MKETNEQRISKLEKEVDELKSIILNLQQQLLNTNQSQKTNEKVEEFCQNFDEEMTELHRVTKNKPIDEKLLNQRLEHLQNPIFKYLVKRYLEDKKQGKVD